MTESTTEGGRVRRYNAQLNILHTEVVAGEIRYWADLLDDERKGQNLAPTLRSIIDAGLRVKRREWVRRFGEPSPLALSRAAEGAIK